MLWGPQHTEALSECSNLPRSHSKSGKEWEKDPSVWLLGWSQVSWCRHAGGVQNYWGQVDRQVSDSHEGGTADDVHSNGAWQIAGLPTVAASEVEGVHGLEVIRFSLQLHLAQELILQDSVVPDLDSDGLGRLLAVEDAFHIVLRH